ncbi:MAG: outer membrane beta-barrel protein [Rikenellaceae bacterium]
MKRAILLLALVVCSISATFAGPFSAGFSAGTSYSDYKFEGLSVDPKLGAYAQVDVDIKILFLSVSPEVTYRFNRFDVTGDEGFSVKNHAVEGSLMGGFTLFKILTLEAGPRYIYDFKSSAKYGDGSFGTIESLHPEWGYGAGATINFSNLRISARYNGYFEKYESSLGLSSAQHITVGIGCRF